jgi:hypothetical protein
VDATTHQRKAAVTKPQIPEALARSVRERRAILFAGAGLSMCVGLPSWRMLIEHMTEELQLDPKCVEETNYQTLAEYYRLKQGSIGTLRSWMDRNWSVPEEQVRASAIHKLIVELDFPIIYTTNYDRNLEVAFQIYKKHFVKVANAKDIAKIEEKVAHIVTTAISTTTIHLFSPRPITSTGSPSIRRSISSSGRTRLAALSCSSATACRTRISGCCCTGYGRPGRARGISRSGRSPSRSPPAETKCRKRCLDAGE